ncbi:MAG TPA: hypothetical protein PKZ32_16420 [Candidatus Melainabacteria bacterium]|nr:hypothetical protein [Candidatus Melainabacteria bacterium]
MADHAYVAFLDILGYKELLAADVRAGTQNFKERMTRAFRTFESVNQSRYAYRAISDSIFISCSERPAAGELLCLLREVYVSFLTEGLLIRGGVSFGQHFQNQSITYSPVLTKAHSLESQVAEFPRIMVDSNILDMYPDLKKDNLVLRSGVSWFLNTVTAATFNKVWAAAEAACAASKSVIERNERVRIKHRWLQDFLLEIADSFKHDRPAPYLGVFDSSELNSVATHARPFVGGSPCEMSGQPCPTCLEGIMDIDPSQTSVQCNKCGLVIPALLEN